MEKPYVFDPELYKIVWRAYKPYACVGSGSTAAAIRHKLTTGEKVCGKLHSKKGQELIDFFRNSIFEYATSLS
ncbi:MAG: hypothetical protein K2X08_06470 [Chlamydiales bacterium]|nr:hypothetical protein [Chlamydiales bacterium]